MPSMTSYLFCFFMFCCQDPHGELQGQNVLIVRYSAELTAAHFGVSVETLNELLASARAKMAEARKVRPRPHLDTKMLASWNGKEIRVRAHPHTHLHHSCWLFLVGGLY